MSKMKVDPAMCQKTKDDTTICRFAGAAFCIINEPAALSLATIGRAYRTNYAIVRGKSDPNRFTSSLSHRSIGWAWSWFWMARLSRLSKMYQKQKGLFVYCLNVIKSYLIKIKYS